MAGNAYLILFLPQLIHAVLLLLQLLAASKFHEKYNLSMLSTISHPFGF